VHAVRHGRKLVEAGLGEGGEGEGGTPRREGGREERELSVQVPSCSGTV
jgi:hypothetical protein